MVSDDAWQDQVDAWSERVAIVRFCGERILTETEAEHVVAQQMELTADEVAAFKRAENKRV